MADPSGSGEPLVEPGDSDDGLENEDRDYCLRCGVYLGPGSPMCRGMLVRELCEECEDDDYEDDES